MKREIKRIPFAHRGSNYEVIATIDGGRVEAKAFQDGKPASRVKFSVDVEDVSDLNAIHGVDGIPLIIRSAKESITGPQSEN